MQPVLIFAALARSSLGPDWDSWRFPPIGRFRVVNDLPRSFPGARWWAELDGHIVAQGEVDVPADSIVELTPPTVDEWASWEPFAVAGGAHEINLRLEHEGKIVSTNSYHITAR